jgi:signal transduction histidine kinase
MALRDTQQAAPAELEVQALRQEVRRLQTAAALGDLVSTTTHEFNNVLTTILNYAKMGIRHPDEATRTRALEKILSAAQRAEKLTNSVLGMARNRSTDPTPTDLAALVDESLVLLERELQKYRVSVETQFAAVPKAMVVGNQIQQVLLNLITNARQAMPHGGRLMLSLAHDNAAGTVDLTIRDTGSGIAAEVLPKIFDRYFSTKSGPDASGKGGTGVGLATCREIIEAAGGRIRVASTVGKGTAFTLKLPVAPATVVVGAPVPLGLPTASEAAAAEAT